MIIKTGTVELPGMEKIDAAVHETEGQFRIYLNAESVADAIGFKDPKELRNFKDWLRTASSETEGGQSIRAERKICYPVEVFRKAIFDRFAKIRKDYPGAEEGSDLFYKITAIQDEQKIQETFEKAPGSVLSIPGSDDLIENDQEVQKVIKSLKTALKASEQKSAELEELFEQSQQEAEGQFQRAEQNGHELRTAKETVEQLRHANEDQTKKIAAFQEAEAAREDRLARIETKALERRRRFTALFREPVFLVLPLLAVVIGSGVDMAFVFMDEFESDLSSILLAAVFSSVVLVFTFNGSGNGRKFAFLFAIIEAAVNAVYFGLFDDWNATSWSSLVVRICATIGLPVALVAYSYLFTDFVKLKDNE